MVRAVTFDMDGTLHRLQPFPPQRRFAEVCALAGIPLSEAQALAAVRARKRQWEAGRRAAARGVRGGAGAWLREYGRAGLRAAGVRGNLDRIAAEVEAAARRFPSDSALDPGARDVLAALRARGIRLGVITNRTGDVPRELRDYGIADHFDCIMYPEVAGTTKSDPAMFWAAYAELGIRPQECLHVGDSPVDDVDGARAVGANPVLYDPLECLECDCPTISRLRDLLDLL
jgi:putative hydrolase of the HAD superfamily